MVENRSEEYIKFIESQMEYFEAKSGKEQKKYRFFSLLSILCNAVIPIASVFSSTPIPFRITITSLSAGAAIFNGVLLVYNSKENWKTNRSRYTELQRELRAYRLSLGEYEGLEEEDAFRAFFARCEDLLQRESMEWSRNMERER